MLIKYHWTEQGTLRSLVLYIGKRREPFVEHDKNPIAEVAGLVLGGCVSPRLKELQPRDGGFCENMKTRGRGVPAVSDAEGLQ